MRILFIKLTSMGDLIHALPALTDAKRAFPSISFDWVIDKNFSEVASWHPAVKNIIPTSHRKWRKNLYLSIKNGEIQQFFKSLRKEKYDLIIDGQSSMKSAIVSLFAKGKRHGLDKNSSREWLAPLAYQKKYFIDKDMHAIRRLRLLFSHILKYPYEDNQPDFGIHAHPFTTPTCNITQKPYLVFVHNASWNSKLWPEIHWHTLIDHAKQEGFQVLLPWGNEAERQRAEKISAGHRNAQVLPFLTLSEHAKILQGAAGAICSDTGLSHLAAALNVPAVTLYGSTSPKLIGTTGLYQRHLMSSFTCTLCYEYACHYDKKNHPDPLCLIDIKPDVVWENFKAVSLPTPSPPHAVVGGVEVVQG